MGRAEDFIARSKEEQVRNSERIDAALRRETFDLAEKAKARKEQTRQRVAGIENEVKSRQAAEQEEQKVRQAGQGTREVARANVPQIPIGQIGEVAQGGFDGGGGVQLIAGGPQPLAGTGKQPGQPQAGGALQAGTPGTESISRTQQVPRQPNVIGPFRIDRGTRDVQSTTTQQNQSVIQAEVDSLAASFAQHDGAKLTPKLQRFTETFKANPQLIREVTQRAAAKFEKDEGEYRQERPRLAQAQASNWGVSLDEGGRIADSIHRGQLDVHRQLTENLGPSQQQLAADRLRLDAEAKAKQANASLLKTEAETRQLNLSNDEEAALQNARLIAAAQVPYSQELSGDRSNTSFYTRLLDENGGDRAVVNNEIYDFKTGSIKPGMGKAHEGNVDATADMAQVLVLGKPRDISRDVAAAGLASLSPLASEGIEELGIWSFGYDKGAQLFAAMADPSSPDRQEAATQFFTSNNLGKTLTHEEARKKNTTLSDAELRSFYTDPETGEFNGHQPAFFFMHEINPKHFNSRSSFLLDQHIQRQSIAPELVGATAAAAEQKGAAAVAIERKISSPGQGRQRAPTGVREPGLNLSAGGRRRSAQIETARKAQERKTARQREIGSKIDEERERRRRKSEAFLAEQGIR